MAWSLDAEIENLRRITKQREQLAEDARQIVQSLKGIKNSPTATADEKRKITTAIKPYTRTRTTKKKS